MDRKRTTNAFIGSAIERVEDFRLLRGRGQFVDDLARENLLHAVILRSSVAHGRIRSIDTAAASARPGVHAVITAADIGAATPTIPLRQDSSPAFKPFEQPVIAHDKVRYVGEPVAVVLAESAAAAEDALDAITLAIEPLPAVVTSAAAASDEILLFEAAGSNRALTLAGLRGDADGAFKGAAYVRRETFAVQRHGAVPMEPPLTMPAMPNASSRSPATRMARSGHCADTPGPIRAPTSAPTARPPRATSRRCSLGPIAFPMSASTSR
jgi:carbon-monoxide dehydrogenase large subunit